ncbi:unnamed protein product [Thelazia callipaeda]|uniref:Protein BIG GRAIN 1-like A n=1 Tax=Thelazia callipaeda TaxID=103827 RepID=A0A0N5CVX6_THECL|nr:unnamed protein product [Thelazia callipaeda]
MNVSNATTKRPSTRRTSSLSRDSSRHHPQYFQLRHTTVASCDANTLYKLDQLTFEKKHNRREPSKAEANLISISSTNSQQINTSFAKIKPRENVVKLECTARSCSFLEENKRDLDKKDIVTQLQHLATAPHKINTVDKSTRGNSFKIKNTSYCQGFAGSPSSLKKTSKKDAKTNKANPSRFLAYSGCTSQVNGETNALYRIENAINTKQMEQKLWSLSSSKRRGSQKNFTYLQQRKTTNEDHLDYTWSYLNRGFCSTEDELYENVDNHTGPPETTTNPFSPYIYSNRLSLG